MFSSEVLNTKITNGNKKVRSENSHNINRALDPNTAPGILTTRGGGGGGTGGTGGQNNGGGGTNTGATSSTPAVVAPTPTPPTQPDLVQQVPLFCG